MSDLDEPLERLIAQDGFAFLHGDETRALLAGHGRLADWEQFAASWGALETDTYMGDGGRYRRRRHAVFRAEAGREAITREPHQPHYQGLDYNALNGGIARWFAPIAPEIAAGPSMTTILLFCRTLFDHLAASAGDPPGAGISSCTSSASRQRRAAPASRHRRECTATGWIMCWCC